VRIAAPKMVHSAILPILSQFMPFLDYTVSHMGSLEKGVILTGHALDEIESRECKVEADLREACVRY
jgi:hypothetical protein